MEDVYNYTHVLEKCVKRNERKEGKTWQVYIHFIRMYLSRQMRVYCQAHLSVCAGDCRSTEASCTSASKKAEEELDSLDYVHFVIPDIQGIPRGVVVPRKFVRDKIKEGLQICYGNRHVTKGYLPCNVRGFFVCTITMHYHIK